jgi:four helix bundle protein
MQIALGSASELQYEVLLAHHLGFLGHEEHDRLSESTSETKRMLTGFFRKPIADG